MVFIYILGSVVLVSLLSLLGALFLAVKRTILETLMGYLLAFSTGILLGSVFFDLLPEGTEALGELGSVMIVFGIVFSFSLEKFIHWHHHENKKSEKPVAFISLIGDGIHNFIDGAIIAVAFLTDISLGITTTLAVIAHEIPHELGDFSILIYSGFSNVKALWFNFLSALTAVAGALIVFGTMSSTESWAPYFISFAAGNFLYIASSDIIPELHRTSKILVSILQTIIIILGVFIMFFLTRFISA